MKICASVESSDEECYFFCRPEHYLENGRRKTKRKARTGFWKGTGKTISVTNKDDNEEIGTRKILVYHDPNRTKWVIHEYAFTAKLNLPFKVEFQNHVSKSLQFNICIRFIILFIWKFTLLLVKMCKKI